MMSPSGPGRGRDGGAGGGRRPDVAGAAPGAAALALAQFICSFAGSNMNVMINDISEDLDATVQGVQTAITLFLLVMAALMNPGGKLTDRWGRKRCLSRGSTSRPRTCRGTPGRSGRARPRGSCARRRTLRLRSARASAPPRIRSSRVGIVCMAVRAADSNRLLPAGTHTISRSGTHRTRRGKARG